MMATLIMFLGILWGCERRGCTDPKARNYDPEATKDDGSCFYIGVMTFYIRYQDTSMICPDAYLELNGNVIGSIDSSQYYTTDTPTCDTPRLGVARISRGPGKYELKITIDSSTRVDKCLERKDTVTFNKGCQLYEIRL